MSCQFRYGKLLNPRLEDTHRIGVDEKIGYNLTYSL